MKANLTICRRAQSSSVLASLIVVLALTSVAYGKGHSPSHFLYIQSNNAAFGQNAVIAFSRDTSDGSLTMLGSVLTGGTGFDNVDQRLGPDDTDGELAVAANNSFLLAVNGGSDTVSVLNIGNKGTLSLAGPPVSSQGNVPASVAVVASSLKKVEDLVYVVNRGNGVLSTEAAPNAVDGTRTRGTPGGTNFTGFTLNKNGALTPISGSTEVLADGSSPSQMVVSMDGNFVFGNQFFSPDATVTPPKPIFPAARSFLYPFAINAGTGALTEGTPGQLPSSDNGAPYILGLRSHPSQQVIYTGLVALGRLAVWTYDSTGALTFVGEESDPNNLGATGGLCWIAIDPAQKFLYTADVIPDEISVFSISGSATPTTPTRVQNFALGGPKDPLPSGQPEPYEYTTAPFNVAVDPSGQFLYVLSNQTCTDNSVDPQCVNGIALHWLNIASDGTLSEGTNSPLVIPQSVVPAHAKGLIVF